MQSKIPVLQLLRRELAEGFTSEERERGQRRVAGQAVLSASQLRTPLGASDQPGAQKCARCVIQSLLGSGSPIVLEATLRPLL